MADFFTGWIPFLSVVIEPTASGRGEEVGG